MFRLYSKGCEYAIRALANIDLDSTDERFQAKSVCEAAGVPESFTRKVFQSLVQGGFLNAVRGPGGGYVLSRAPEEISLLWLIQAVDGNDTYANCIMGLDECKSENPCPLHTRWSDAKGDMLIQLEAVTLYDLMETVRKRKVANPLDVVLLA